MSFPQARPRVANLKMVLPSQYSYFVFEVRGLVQFSRKIRHCSFKAISGLPERVEGVYEYSVRCTPYLPDPSRIEVQRETMTWAWR